MIWYKRNLWIAGALLLFFFLIAVGWVEIFLDAHLFYDEHEEVIGFIHYALIIVVCIVLLFSVSLVYSRFQWQKEREKSQYLEQEALLLDLHQLKNQINPHFLFNSLNSLSALISTDPQLAKEFVLHLSKIYRYVLEQNGASLVAVSEEIAFIRHYYFLQQIRFRDELQLQIGEGLEFEERKIPVMSLQMLVENALKHNEITYEHPLTIRIYRQTEELIVENDFWPRLDTKVHSFGVGFDNIRKIYGYCSDRQFKYHIKEGKFICSLPMLEVGDLRSSCH